MSNPINVMEAIWEMSPKEADGRVRYDQELVDFLWDYGFVDTKKFPKETWREFFGAFRQPDGTYQLNHKEFLNLEPYRYTGEIRIPLDPFRINEGKYTDEGFDKLVELSIAPSCSLLVNELQKFVTELKNEFRQSDQLILIKMPAKRQIKKLIEDHPSPLRRLEILFDKLLEQQAVKQQAIAAGQKISRVATPEEQQRLQASLFTTQSSFAETQAQRLKEVTKARSKTETLPEASGEELKKIKRSKKGIRG